MADADVRENAMISEQPLSAAEIRELRTLLEIEKIRKQQQLYSHLLDSLRIAEWAELFAEDAIADWGPFGSCRGRAAILAQSKPILAGRERYFSLHMTTNLWIELTGPASATSRANLMDVANDPARSNPVKFFGVYEFDWAKVSGEWKITCQRNRFLWPERTAGADFPLSLTPSPLG
jgi:hypothetical protein